MKDAINLGVIGLGVIGLGRAFTLMLPTLQHDARVKLVAGFDTLPTVRAAFDRQFGAAKESAQSLCQDASVEWVYIATPHQFHAEHVALAAKYGKHVLLEKPMALSLEDCTNMIAACEAADVQLIIGPSHSFDAPVLLARDLIQSQRLGKVRMINALNYTDFMFRPRRPEELVTALGGGVVFSQAAHQIDIVRLLAGGHCTSLRASTGQWDKRRTSEAAYSALMQFQDGVFASVTYSGMGYYDSDALMNGVGEMGQHKDLSTHANSHTRFAACSSESAEVQAKADRNFGGAHYKPAAANQPSAGHQHFGFIIVSCEFGDLRLTPFGVEIHDRHGLQSVAAPNTATPRQTVIDELWQVARAGQPPLHSGAWSMATLEVCLGILKSQETQREVALHYQVKA
jgi:phthalate 4,5-cis-dihydrodiol dehydrogenase